MLDDVYPGKKIIFLEITSYRGGFGSGAEHYYGTFRPVDDYEIEVCLRKKMSVRDAAHLTRKDSYGFVYKAGESTKRFEDKEDLIKLGASVYKAHFPDAVILVCGDRSTLQPQLVLACEDTGLMEKINGWYHECERLGWWNDGNNYQVGAICKEWRAVWKKFEEVING
jgi:hypothetical protein